MRPVSADWADAIAASHQIALRVTVLSNENETELEGTISGSVSLDAGAETRGRLDLVLVDGSGTLVPSVPTDQLAPYGNELRVERGVRYSDGSAEYAELGVYRIEDVDVEEDAGQRTIRITGLDRSARIIDARFEEPYQVADGTNYSTAILEAIEDVYPGVVTQFAEVSHTAPQILVEEGSDRWATVQEWATAAGQELFFDGAGVLVLRPKGQAVSASIELVEGGTSLLSVSRRWKREGAYNRVIASGESTAEEEVPIPRGVATDDNPASPTYYFGPFGRVPRFYVSPFVTSDDQASDAAEAILNTAKGTTQEVEFGVVVNPALEPGDTVQITREATGIDEEHIIDSLTFPLGASEPMSGTTRAVEVF